MTLHELTLEWQAIQAALDASDGELTPEIEAKLAAFEEALPAKVDGYCRLIKNLEIKAATIAEQAKPFKAEAKRIEDRAKSMVNAAERLRGRLKEELQAQKQDGLKTDLFTVSVVEIDPAITWEGKKAPPKEFRKTVTSLDGDKAVAWFKNYGMMPHTSFKCDRRYSLRIR